MIIYMEKKKLEAIKWLDQIHQPRNWWYWNSNENIAKVHVISTVSTMIPVKEQEEYKALDI